MSSNTPPTDRSSPPRLVWGVALLAVLAWGSFLGARDLWYPDEPDIGEVAQSMYESGDWVSPRRMGEIWVDYPPMIYWAGTMSSRVLGGMSEFSLRLPIALAAALLVLLVTFAGGRWFGWRAGLWSGVALLTFQEFSYEAVNYRPDVLFSLPIAAGMILYVRGEDSDRSMPFRAAAFAMLGLAMLAKGPLGLLLPGLVLTLWHGVRRQWRRILELAPLALISVAIYLSWFLLCARAMGTDNIVYELYAQNFARFLEGGARGHAQPPHYYLTRIWIDLAPWSLLMPSAIVWARRTALWRDRRFQLALWWLGTFVVFLSLAATKRQLYLLPAHAAAALLVGPYLASVGRSSNTFGPTPSPRAVQVYLLVIGVILLALGVVGLTPLVAGDALVSRIDLDDLERVVAGKLTLPLATLGVVALACGAWTVMAWRRRQLERGLIRVAASFYGVYLVLLGWVMPTLNPVKTYTDAALWVRQQIGDESRFGMVDREKGAAKRGALRYYSGAMVDLFEERSEVDAFLSTHPGSLVLVYEDETDRLFRGDPDWERRVIGKVRTSSRDYLAIGPDLRPQP